MNKEILLDDNHEAIVYLRKKDKRLAKVIDMVGPISYTIHDDYYAFLVHEIIEQMLSIKVAAKIFERLEELCSGQITPQSISLLSYEEIKSIGTSRSKVNTINTLTNLILSNNLNLEQIKTYETSQILTQLTSIRGIGNWTAKMFLLFCLDRPDILPYEDVAFLQTYKWMYKTEDTAPATVQKNVQNGHPILPLLQDICIEHSIPGSPKPLSIYSSKSQASLLEMPDSCLNIKNF